ncbi:MAG: hypothetical protein D3915_11235 [Candidatus Electrothrix sp. AU1_5]|nr:hypothetical protein [Candidatus Electrothrix gigas]
MKTLLKIVGVLFVLTVGVVFVLLGGPQSLYLFYHFQYLVKTNNHRAVVSAAIPVMRTTTDEMMFIGDSLAELPSLIAEMEPKYVFVSPDYMVMEFHGGFNHFGFRIDNQKTQWKISWYTEGSHHFLLSVGKDEQVASPNAVAAPRQ